MSPAVHDKLDATINDLKGKPDTVNKRLRYKLDSSAVAASADGAAAIAGKIADGVACKNPHRLFRPSKTHEKQHKAHGASQCPTASLDSAPPAPAHWQCAVTWQCAGDGERSRRRVHHPFLPGLRLQRLLDHGKAPGRGWHCCRGHCRSTLSSACPVCLGRDPAWLGRDHLRHPALPEGPQLTARHPLACTPGLGWLWSVRNLMRRHLMTNAHRIEEGLLPMSLKLAPKSSKVNE